MKRVAIGQAGGPTSVINTSLVGFLEHINKNFELYYVENGYTGLVENCFFPLEGSFLRWVRGHKYIPGACLGAGRYEFSDDKVQLAVQNLKAKGIDVLVFIGGNGTMAALEKIGNIAQAINYDLKVVGIPKTVDNDLHGTNHAPGFGSAARYVALATRDISKDLEAMRNFEQVRIIETMGRNTGWLAAASGALKVMPQDGPHLIYVPEKPFTKEMFLLNVQETIEKFGIATVVVSEGVFFKGEKQVEKANVIGRSVLGGISQELESLVKGELDLNARAEILGMNQRCSSTAISSQDQLEAYEVGRKAAELIKMDISGVMVSIQAIYEQNYSFRLTTCQLIDVVNKGERQLPLGYIENPQSYYDWLMPLLGEGIKPFPSARESL